MAALQSHERFVQPRAGACNQEFVGVLALERILIDVVVLASPGLLVFDIDGVAELSVSADFRVGA
jgi:hypothetical protein